LDGSVTTALLEAAIDRVRDVRNARLEIKGYLKRLEAQAPRMQCVPWEETYVLELPKPEERLRFGNARNHSRIRTAVNHATRAGVAVRAAETESDLRAWYALYLDTMRSHGVVPRPYRLFAAMWKVLLPARLMKLLLAEQHEGNRTRLLAGSMFLMFGETVFYAFTGGRRRGAKPTMLYRYYYSDSGKTETGVVQSGAELRGLARTIWRRVPLRVTSGLSYWPYRYL
jgi:hypothetical protein